MSNEIQMQASNRRSSWSAEASVQRSNQDGQLASEALHELKRARRRARVVRGSSGVRQVCFFPTHPPANMNFLRRMGKRRGRGHGRGGLAVIFPIVRAVRNGIRAFDNRLASVVGSQYERAVRNGTTRQHAQMVCRLVVIMFCPRSEGAVRNGIIILNNLLAIVVDLVGSRDENAARNRTIRKHRHTVVDSRWLSRSHGPLETEPLHSMIVWLPWWVPDVSGSLETAPPGSTRNMRFTF